MLYKFYTTLSKHSLFIQKYPLSKNFKTSFGFHPIKTLLNLKIVPINGGLWVILIKNRI